MDNETAQVLVAVLNTLENVSVAGRRNVENMRNSMVALERLIEQANRISDGAPDTDVKK